MAFTVGIDLTDEYIAVSTAQDTEAAVWPSVISRAKKEDVWEIGEDAYRNTLSGDAVITDHLLRLLSGKKSAAILGQDYTAVDLIGKLLGKALSEKCKTEDFSGIESLVIALSEPKKELMDGVFSAAVSIGIPGERVHITSHEEAFCHYVLACDKNVYANKVCLFDLGAESLHYFEFIEVRGVSRRSVICESAAREEGFHTDILTKDSGRELADRIMTETAKQCMDGQIISGVFLTGSGFDSTDWARDFLSYVCRRRRVLYEKGLFAEGARLLGEKDISGKAQAELVFCDTTIGAELSTEVSVGERKTKLILCPAGERWYGLSLHLEVLPRDEETISFTIAPYDQRKTKYKKEMPVPRIPGRPEGTTRTAVDLSFESAKSFTVTCTDLGFGELFPALGTVTRKEMEI